MMRRSLARSIAVLVALVVATPVAIADNRTEAILLFDQGVKEMKAGQFEKACNSFERSLAAYPDSGTKGSLGRCYEKLGRLASSWLIWRELADLAPSADLRKDAAVQAAKLEPRVAHYVIKVQPQASGLTVTINGKTVGLTEVPVPIDAGGVIVRAYASGRKDWSADLTVADGNTLTIEVPPLEILKKTTPDKPIDTVRPPPPPPPTSKRKPIGFAVAGVGAVGIAVGAVFGFKAQNKFKDAKDTCGGSIDNCTGNLSAAQTQVDDARSAGNLSTALFVVGGAALVAGIVLVVTAPKAEKQMTITPMATARSAGAMIIGRF